MLLITALIWGTAFVAQSVGMDYVEPFTFNCVRTIVGGIALVPVVLAMRRGRLSKDTVAGGLACGLCLFLAGSVQQIGISMTTAGKAAFVTALYIILVPLIGMLFRKRIPKVIWVCIPVAVTGFWLLCVREGFSVSKGDLLCLASAFFFSCHIITIDYFTGRDTDGVAMSCIQFFVAGLLSAAPMFLFETPRLGGVLEARWPILFTGVLSCGAGYTLQILGQKRTEPSTATLILSLESVFAALAGWAVLGERLSVKETAGCALVFAAVLLAQLPPERLR